MGKGLNLLIETHPTGFAPAVSFCGQRVARKRHDSHQVEHAAVLPYRHPQDCRLENVVREIQATGSYSTDRWVLADDAPKTAYVLVEREGAARAQHNRVHIFREGVRIL